MGGGSHDPAQSLRDRADSRLRRNDDKGRKMTEKGQERWQGHWNDGVADVGAGLCCGGVTEA